MITSSPIVRSEAAVSSCSTRGTDSLLTALTRGPARSGAVNADHAIVHETPSLHGDLIDGRVRLPRIGAVVAGTTPSLPWLVVDAAGRVEQISVYLRDRMLGDANTATCRSYGYDLLRWWRPVNCTMS